MVKGCKVTYIFEETAGQSPLHPFQPRQPRLFMGQCVLFLYSRIVFSEHCVYLCTRIFLVQCVYLCSRIFLVQCVYLCTWIFLVQCVPVFQDWWWSGSDRLARQIDTAQVQREQLGEKNWQQIIEKPLYLLRKSLPQLPSISVGGKICAFIPPLCNL